VRELRELTTLRLGGPPCSLVDCNHERSLVNAVRCADAHSEPLLVLGGGSNVVVADEGFPGTVARVLTSGIEESSRDGRIVIRAAAGESWDSLVQRCVDEQLAGVECLSGIPGMVGATPIQNVGAYGQEVSETIAGVRVYDRQQRRVEDVRPELCGFTYRSSVFKRTPDRWVVLAVEFLLDRQACSRPVRYAELARTLGIEPGTIAPISDVRSAVIGLRRAKGMVLDRTDADSVSAGSFFLNPVLSSSAFDALKRRVGEVVGTDVSPPVFPHSDGNVKTSAAWLIERAGFNRGYGSPDGIAISRKHTLALTNRGQGTTAELVALAREIAAAVWARFGVELVPEPVFVGLAWQGRGNL
jgi:UDP-N-acetylmuramate dehydrogenase